ncbi:NADH:flavin oxidoreductase/NADH oxidase [Nitratireductor aquimarinus]|uniref:NADH:flavin oxidoreductase/NADH oxidase n=1 Tax=Nitratireductor aquimarinus TaxID=889300 RepID=UPI001A8FBA39|nr:NADH:flavin oxidoreductase/NADH oxidase [Nitratireductor aquimarinus]MBN8245676.1 NADH:flavin oxidoreductase/NADH oxidase [Nitratireductor aquimarinus]MBY6134059.1 NADH:flavin oxidoreductase/NADH oxidase [Nitratireductor aquimarinus]MCA1305155.1 NADH:flavin oxidoreductase/NADH oxidase [Nitratireductor aquimarinus]
MTALFSPLSIGNLTLENRIVVSPMCQYSAVDGVANEWHLAHLGTLANSGAGLVVVEATAVEPAGRISHGDLGLYDDETQKALADVVSFCKKSGNSRLGIQLAHAGRKASCQRPWEGGAALGAAEAPWQTIAPSALAFADGWHVPAAMQQADLDRVIEAHVAAARRAVAIGFDMIEVHAAHGYLLHQFLSPFSNRREDEYGGSSEARMRYPLKIIAAIRAALPDGYPLGVRITGSDWAEGGIQPEDAVAFAQRLREIGVDFVCVTGAGVAPNAAPPIGPAYQAGLAEKVRREAGIKTRAVGLIASPAQAEAVVAEGKADLVALGRAFLDNPHWGWEAARVLGAETARPPQYQRAAPSVWPGAAWL